MNDFFKIVIFSKVKSEKQVDQKLKTNIKYANSNKYNESEQRRTQPVHRAYKSA